MIEISYEKIICPICESNNFENIYSKSINEATAQYIIKVLIHLSICKDCGCIYQNPAPKEESLTKYYEVQSECTDESNSIRYWYFEMLDFIKDNCEYKKVKSVIDIGCRRGEMLRLFKEDGKEVLGIEPSDFNAEYVEKNFNIPVIKGLFNKEMLEKRKFDLVILTSVLEHIKNPASIVNDIDAILNDEGYLFISVPNLDDCLNNGGYNNIADFFCFQHLQHLNGELLAALVQRNGFSVIAKVNSSIGIFMICKKGLEKEIESHNYYNRNKATVEKYLSLHESSISNIIKRISENNQAGILIYGAGTHTTQLMEVLDFDSLNIIGVCDSDKNRHGMYLAGFKVCSISDIDRSTYSKILISSKMFEGEIYDFLRKEYRDKEIIKLYS